MTYGWYPEVDWLIKSRSGKPYCPQFDMAHIRWKKKKKKRTSLLCLARFIDRPHQEKPGSPKQCLHSCQAATHTQTLAYITVRYWRSADTNTPKQKTWGLCNTFCSNTSYPSPHHTNMRGTLETKASEAVLRVICVAWPVCACVCLVLYVAGVERDAL